MSLDLTYTPEVFVEDIEKLTEEEWLGYRRAGLGGSDIAAVFGVSPWTTTRDLYYDKKGIKPAAQGKGNWVAMEVGHRLEELVAQVFFEKTGLRPYAVRKMFRHPLYPFMLADVDYFIDMPDGKKYILECKTTSYQGKDKWGTDSEPVIPYHYELQGRHYMAVSNVDGMFFACLYDNNENSLIIRKMDRDLSIEEDVIEQEKGFWDDYMIAGEEPPYTEKPDMVLESLKRHFGLENGIVDIPESYQDDVLKYFTLKDEKKKFDGKIKEIDAKLKQLIAPIVEVLQGKDTGQIVTSDGLVQCGYTTRTTTSIGKSELENLRLVHPGIYDEYAKTRQSQSFYIKKVL